LNRFCTTLYRFLNANQLVRDSLDIKMNFNQLDETLGFAGKVHLEKLFWRQIFILLALLSIEQLDLVELVLQGFQSFEFFQGQSFFEVDAAGNETLEICQIQVN